VAGGASWFFSAAGAALCLMSHCCTKGGMVLSEWKAPLSLSVMPVDPGFPFRLTPMSFVLRVTNSP